MDEIWVRNAGRVAVVVGHVLVHPGDVVLALRAAVDVVLARRPGALVIVGEHGAALAPAAAVPEAKPARPSGRQAAMSVTLAALVSRLTAAVAARGGVPSTAQYGQCVEDAVADYSRLRPLERVTTLALVAGTAAYALPEDFLRLITLARPASYDGVIACDQGLIAVGRGFGQRERTMIAGGQITFSPTPAYAASRELWYAGAHVLGDDDAYPDMSAEDASILLLQAQASALMLQANAVAGNAWSYQVGDERVDKTKQAESLRNQAEGLSEEYVAKVKAAIGPVGMRG